MSRVRVETVDNLFVADLDTALPLYESIVGAPADLQFGFDQRVDGGYAPRARFCEGVVDAGSAVA